MNNQKHTPGPWGVTETRDESNFEQFLVNQESKWPALIAVCGVVETQDRDFITPKQAKANARLIAAATDLLEALEKLKHHYTESNMVPFTEFAPLWQECITAIAKAKGE